MDNREGLKMPVKFGLTVKQVIEKLSKLDPDLEITDEDHWPIVEIDDSDIVYIGNCPLPGEQNKKYNKCKWCSEFPCSACRLGVVFRSDYRDE